MARCRVRSLVGLGLPAAVLTCALLGSACEEPRDAIVVAENRITIENQTRQRWTQVEVWLNDHYRVVAPALEAGGRLDVPLDTFVAGYGQRFDRRRQSPFGIEVTARTESGAEVRLVWGKGRRR
jgi:hypothetical protein